jgi:hypothetical protein
VSDANEPAFPTVEYPNLDTRTDRYPGLTKREYFAGLALQGILVSAASEIKHEDLPRGAAIAALNLADALLTELAKEKA